MGEVSALQKRLGITSLYVTHDQSEAMAISDRVVIMKDGNIMQQGTPTEIYEQPNSRFVANFIGKENFIDGVFKGRDGEAALVEINGHIFSIPAPGVMPSASVLILNSGLDIIAAERLLYLCMSPSGATHKKLKYISQRRCAPVI